MSELCPKTHMLSVVTSSHFPETQWRLEEVDRARFMSRACFLRNHLKIILVCKFSDRADSFGLRQGVEDAGRRLKASTLQVYENLFNLKAGR